MRKIIIIFMFFIVSCSHRFEPPYIIPSTQPEPKPIKNVKVALVLGAGGIKGLAHLGAMEYLEEKNVKFDLIAGSSAGSIVGALYADGHNIKEIKQKLFELNKWDLIDLDIFSFLNLIFEMRPPARGDKLSHFIYNNISVDNIEDLKIPFIAVATSLKENKSYLFRAGPIVPAVVSSASLPPLFRPVKVYGQILNDGGVIEPVPVATARSFNPKLIIAINVSSPPHTFDTKDSVSMLGLTYHALWLSYNKLAKTQAAMADIFIEPDLRNVGVLEAEDREKVYKAGYEAAKKAWLKISKKLALMH